MSCFLTYIKPVIPLTNPHLEGPYGRARCLRFFNFYIFYFHFLQKYIFDMEIYRNIPRPPRCRAAGANLQKKEENKLRTGPWEPAARQPGGRPPRPLGCGAAGLFFLQLSPFREIISHMCHFSNFLQK